jgi:hypothetical protein
MKEGLEVKITGGKRRWRTSLIWVLTGLLVVLWCSPALAVTKNWIGGGWWWHIATSWNPSGVPAAGDDVILSNVGTTYNTVYYYNTASPAPVLNSLTINAPTGNMTMNQGYGGYAHALASLNEYVGSTGKGTHLQSLGTNTITNGLYLGYNAAGANGTYTLSGGSLSAANQYLGNFTNTTGTITQSGGTNTASSNLYLGYGPGSQGTYTLSGTGALTAPNAYIGNMGSTTGTFTQSAGTVTVQNNLAIGGGPGTSGTYNLQGGLLQGGNIILNTGGTFNQTGSGEFFSPSFNQNGGTVTGTLVSEGTYNYNSGVFSGRLVNQGNANFNANFTAGNGVENQGTINVPYVNNTVWRRLEFNGAGLDNSGAINMTSGALAGSGPLVNTGWMNLNSVEIQSLFTNNGVLQVTNNTSLQATGTNVNNGEIRLVYNSGAQPNMPMGMALLHLGLPSDGAILSNNGVINLNGNVIGGGGTLNNLGAGIINGSGYISSNFNNQGVINMGSGSLNITQAFTNRGTINGLGTLFGGAITNYGTIEGGTSGLIVGSAIVNHGQVGVGGGGRVTMAGTLTNPSDGLITVRTDSKLIVNQGLAVNNGVISVNAGNFDNNNYTLTNNGKITTRGSMFSTGGLTNASGGQIYFTGTGQGDSMNRITGNVTNNSGGTIKVDYDRALFTGNVTNNGTFKVHSTTITILGTQTGSYDSDPADNYLTTVVMRPQDHMTGGMEDGVRDRFFISNDFINQSAQTLAWNTVEAYLAFVTGDDNLHQFYLPGTDLGGSRQGYQNNFAWNTLDITGQQIELVDGNTTKGGAFYAGLLLGAALNGNKVSNIYGNGLDLYYDPLLADNAYLKGGTYALLDGGSLAPVHTPLPPTLWMVLSGLAGLGMLRRRKVNKS